MNLTFQSLSEKLPAGSIEFVGNNQVKLNISQLTGDNLTLESACLEAFVKLMQGLAMLTTEVNQARALENPPKPAIEFVSQILTGTPEQPKYEFKLIAKVDTSLFISNLVDPTV
jgi:hypothetical protein